MKHLELQVHYWRQSAQRNLATAASLFKTHQQRQSLRTITTFNIAGRYDEIKFAFYKQCTPRFTKKYFTITNELFVCLKDEYQKK